MNGSAYRIFLRSLTSALIFSVLVFAAAPALSQEYAALDGVKGLHTVFDYGQGSPEVATLVFPAIRDTYRSESVTSLADPPVTVIVFHAEAVKLLSTDRAGNQQERETLDKVAEMIRQFKEDGVKMEVCMYAVEVMGVDPDTIMPEIDKVGNGFISVSGYQAQGYSVISVP